MDVAQAQKLIEALRGSGRDSGPNRVMRGLEIIARHVKDTSPEFEHGVIYVGGLTESLASMTEEEVLQLGRLGWVTDANFDSWTHF